MNKKTQDGSIENSHGSENWDGRPVGRETLLVKIIIVLVGISIALVYSVERGRAQRSDNPNGGPKQQQFDLQISENAKQMMEQGKQIFRYDTFGDEAYWSGKLKLHQAIQGSKFYRNASFSRSRLNLGSYFWLNFKHGVHGDRLNSASFRF